MKHTLVCTLVLFVCSACSEGSGPVAPSVASTATAASSIEAAGVASTPAFRSPASVSAPSVPVNYRAHLSGDQVVPPRDTQAQGEAVLQLSPDGATITYRVIASNIDNVTAAHIHIAVAGSVGPLTAFLSGPVPPGGGRSDGILASGTLTAADLFGPLAGQPLSVLVDAINEGRVYVDVPTNDGVPPVGTGPGDFQAGELRGQLH